MNTVAIKQCANGYIVNQSGCQYVFTDSLALLGHLQRTMEKRPPADNGGQVISLEDRYPWHFADGAD